VLRDPHQQPLERPPLPPGTPQRLILNEEQAAEFLNMPRPNSARWQGCNPTSLLWPQKTPLYTSSSMATHLHPNP
jgi:hypothetical protein